MKINRSDYMSILNLFGFNEKIEKNMHNHNNTVNKPKYIENPVVEKSIEEQIKSKINDIYIAYSSQKIIRKVLKKDVKNKKNFQLNIEKLVKLCFSEFKSCCTSSLLIIQDEKMIAFLSNQIHILNINMNDMDYKNANDTNMTCRDPIDEKITEHYHKCCRFDGSSVCKSIIQ
ncbi:hypothetical protein COBT_001946 [Conglomerata obtusa]